MSVTTESGRETVRSGLDRLCANMQATVLGSASQSELLVAALLAGGHVLIKGLPGMGKTSLARVLAASTDCRFKRVQFTPDLLPADILGYSIYDQHEGVFRFHPGAVFTHVLLADEINRTTPRVQSALLEAMNEGQVTVDGKTHRLEPPFFVIATENHLDATGTFPLPDSELDRFAVSFSMSRPDVETQGEILKLHLQGDPEAGVDKALGRETLLALQEQVRDVRVADELIGYVAALVDATHAASELREGVSARASLALMRTSQAYAFLAGRDAVYPDDIKHMLPHVFGHRLRPRGRSSRQGGHRVQEVLEGILAAVPVP